MDQSVLMSGHQKREFAAHVLHWHSNVSLTDLVQGLSTLWQCPKLNPCVPSSRDDNRVATARRVDQTVDIFNGLLVRAHVHDLIGLQVEALYRVVCAGQKDSHRVDLPAHSKDRAVDLLRTLLLHLGGRRTNPVILVLDLEHD